MEKKRTFIWQIYLFAILLQIFRKKNVNKPPSGGVLHTTAGQTTCEQKSCRECTLPLRNSALHSEMFVS